VSDVAHGPLVSVFRTFFHHLCSFRIETCVLLCILVKSYRCSLRFGVIDSFLQELCPFILDKFKNFSAFHSITIFAAIGLKHGILLCTEELQFMFLCY
jgi:hypothetical protein